MFFILIQHERDERVSKYLNEQTKDIETQYNSVYNFLKQSSRNIFNVIINKPDVLFILDYIQYAQDENDKNEIRKKLYNYLKDDYIYLQTIGIKQLHFHLPNNESFLRFHKPELYGDDLSKIRYSVKYISKHQKPIDGLEMGKVIHGFRFVYPLFSSSEQYLGSVEVSMLSDRFKELIEKNFNLDLRFLIRKDIIDLDNKIIIKDAYHKSNEDDRFYYTSAGSSDFVTNSNRTTKKLISQKIDLGEPFSVSNCDKEEKYLATYIPIKDIKNKTNIAYFVAYKKSTYLKELNTTYIISLIVMSLLNLLFSYFVFQSTNKRKLLEKKITKSKKELSNLNKNLKSQVELEIQKNKEKEELLIHQSKMATMGEMLENISHQWKQPLNSISIISSNMIFEQEHDILTCESTVDQATMIMENVEFLSSTIENFKEYFKASNRLEKTSLKECIDTTLKLVNATLYKNDIKLIVDVEDKEVLMIQGLFIHVLLNLINNAKDALVLNSDIFNRYIYVTTSVHDDIININVKDNAGGIDEMILDHIFDQYFTTKKQDGTGIGLYMSKKIIQENFTGTLEAKNIEFSMNDTIYKGANFCISLKLSSSNKQ